MTSRIEAAYVRGLETRETINEAVSARALGIA